MYLHCNDDDGRTAHIINRYCKRFFVWRSSLEAFKLTLTGFLSTRLSVCCWFYPEDGRAELHSRVMLEYGGVGGKAEQP